MKDYRIVASNAPVTTINVAGTPHHYFHSKVLGNIRAIRIAENVNLDSSSQAYATKPLSKGEQLEALMDCGERLHKRYLPLYQQYCAMPESDWKGRNALFARIERIHQASTRVARKIGLLFTESR